MSSRNQANNDEEFMKKLDTASPEEAKNLVISSIVPECRPVATKFFDCVENYFKTIDTKESSKFEQVEKMLNETIVPECMKKHDLESCLKKYEDNKI